MNSVVCENQKTGTPESTWDVTGAGDPTIQGFATDISVDLGQPISFKIKTDAHAYTIDIYRLGWYGGDGARKITSVTPSASLPQTQPNCVTDPTTGVYDCGGWQISATWNVPSTAVSGVYIARLTRSDTQGASQIPFIVRNDTSTSDVFFQTSDSTWQAYNLYGGADFYPNGTGPDGGRAYKLSYNRPFATRGDNSGRDYLFSNEYPMIRFLERNGYDISYTTDLDSDRRGNLIRNHKVFMSTGHDEYWSGPQRANVEAARDAGVNLAFFSGNEVYWKTRWEPSEDGSSTANRTLVSYKETWADAKIDPSTEWTGTWRDPRFTPPSNGGRPENGLTGTAYMTNDVDAALQVPAVQGKMRLWRNSDVATQAALGQTSTLAPHTLGYESDEDLDNASRPAGLVDLSTTVASTPSYLRDWGSTTTSGTTTHHVTLYRAPSGALVFSAGTIQWAWGLDNDHDGIESPADTSMQQATVNLFADMGVQPSTLIGTLHPASASADVQAPTSVITSPVAGTTVTAGSQVTLQGTALDNGGGKVAGVEVSVDGGTSWHEATGTTSWSYTFVAFGLNNLSVQVRATDDSGNIQATPVSQQYPLTGAHSLFGVRAPANPAVNDPTPVELGVKFTADTDGFVTAVRFYKGTGNTGTHTGSLWSATGTRLATGTFTGESATGWQTLTFTTPVAVTGNTTYVASYYAPAGNYAADPWQFSTGYSATPLSAVRSLGANGNGVFHEGAGFPNQSYHDTNYYVDVLYVASQDASPSVISTNPADQATYVAPSVHPQAVYNKSLTPGSVQFALHDGGGATVAGTTAYDDATKTVTFTPSAALTAGGSYTATVNAQDLQGHAAPTTTWTFTIDPDPDVSRLFAIDATPASASANDPSAVELGVKFTPDVAGTVVGVRFYQGSGNTGTHTGSLWTSTGILIARATFSGETGSGWQTVRFASPVAVAAGQTYVASYYAPNGHYAANGGFFTSTWTNGHLSAPSGANGLYSYGGDTFPTDSWNSTNYWVDPLFVAGGTAPTPTTMTIFADPDTPAVASFNDPSSIELGIQFHSDVAGQVTGVRFYKGGANTGTHTGSLWGPNGQLLATGTFTNETDTGWQTLTFSSPVTITAGTTYTASYHTSTGYYSVTTNTFNGNGFDRAPLHVAASGASFHYGSGFPDGSSVHNYWVDVVFKPNS